MICRTDVYFCADPPPEEVLIGEDTTGPMVQIVQFWRAQADSVPNPESPGEYDIVKLPDRKGRVSVRIHARTIEMSAWDAERLLDALEEAMAHLQKGGKGV